MTPNKTTKSETTTNARAWGLNLKSRIRDTRTRKGEEEVSLWFHPSNALAEAYAKAKVPIGRMATRIWEMRPKDLSKVKVAAKDGSGQTNRTLGWMLRHPNYDDLMAMEKAGVSFDGWLNLRLSEELPNASKMGLEKRASKSEKSVKKSSVKVPGAKVQKSPPQQTPRKPTTSHKTETPSEKLLRENPPVIPTTTPQGAANAQVISTPRAIRGDDAPALPTFGSHLGGR